ncbi:MAG: twin-arginine translocation signal domain-containing protein [Chloroflexi bacterium]|nr:twin-arginine translocation signal domain-containing protein [Chloroflexota bacterium]
MAPEKLVEAIARQIDRRDFLKKLGAGTFGALLAFLGLSRPAFAVDVACCHLCYSPGSTTCNTCAWCWNCWWDPALGGDGWGYQCCECHSTNDGCPYGDCGNVDHSYYRRVGTMPSP